MSQSNRWQYQPKVEGHPPETPPVPFMQDMLPGRAASAIAPLAVASAFLFTPSPAAPDFVPAQPETPRAIARRVQPQDIAYPTFVPLEDFDWFQQHPDRVPGQRPIVGTGVFVTDPLPPPIVFPWQQQIDPTLPPKPIVVQTQADPISFRLTEFDWFRETVGPQPPPKPRQLLGGEARTELVHLSFDWWQQPSEPVRTVAPGPQGGSFAPVFTPAPAFTELVALPQPDITRRKPWTAVYSAQVLSDFAVGDLSWASETIIVFPRLRIQPQELAEPIFFEAAPTFTELVAFPQPDIMRRPVRPEGFFAIAPTQREEQIGWGSETTVVFKGKARLFQSRAEPLFTPAPAFTELVNIQQPDIFRRLTRPEGMWATGLPRFQILDWLQQSPEPQRVKRIIDARGAFVFAPAPRVDLVQLQQPEPIRRIRRPEGLHVEPSRILVPFEWQRQPSEPVLEIKPRLEGFFRIPLRIIVPFEWQRQPSEPTRRPTRPDGLFSIPPRIVVPFEWQRQPSEPFPSKVKRPEGGVVFLFAPAPRVDVFHLQQTDLFRRPTRPDGLFVVAPQQPTITLDMWYQQYPEWLPHRFWNITQTAFPPFPIPNLPEELEFFIQACLILWEITLNAILPAPSGWEFTGQIYVPSGYVAPEDELLAPSGWVQRQTNAPWDMDPEP